MSTPKEMKPIETTPPQEKTEVQAEQPAASPAPSGGGALRPNAESRGRVYDSILDTIGNTPLVRVSKFMAKYGLEAEILAKLQEFGQEYAPRQYYHKETDPGFRGDKSLFCLAAKLFQINNQWGVFQRYMSQFAHDSGCTNRLVFCMQAAGLCLAGSSLHDQQVKQQKLHVKELAGIMFKVWSARNGTGRGRGHVHAKRAAARGII